MQGGGPTDAEVLEALYNDPRLKRLEAPPRSLSLFRACGIEGNEVLHSRLLATLLDPRYHRRAEEMLRDLLTKIIDDGDLDTALEWRLSEVARELWRDVVVRVEHHFIDVVVEVALEGRSVVVGIENKIHAGEGERQIARYQQALERVYSGWDPVIVFLTPSGREPDTADPSSPVPVIAASYGEILDVVEAARLRTRDGSRDERVLTEVVEHLREDIVGDPEVKSIVRELWRDHRRAMSLAVRHQPRMSDIRDLYVSMLKERFGQDIDIYYFSGRGAGLREIKMDLPEWFERGFPFTFMLHVREGGRPRVRVLIWRDNYREHADGLQAWARRVNASEGPIIDEGFTHIGGWKVWHRVFREEDHPDGALVGGEIFDEETAAAAVEAVAVLVERLRPHVEGD